MWHSSVAWLDLKKSKAVPTKQLFSARRKFAMGIAKRMLSGAGQLPSRLEQFEVAFHYRRCLTDEEIALLSPAWCALPAIDEAGEGIVLESDT